MNYLLEELDNCSSILYIYTDNLQIHKLTVMTAIDQPSFVRTHDDSEEDEILKMAGWKKHLFNQEVSETVEEKINFFIPRCHVCKDAMQFAEGDIIYGDKWYHNSCWRESEKIVPTSSQIIVDNT